MPKVDPLRYREKGIPSPVADSTGVDCEAPLQMDGSRPLIAATLEINDARFGRLERFQFAVAVAVSMILRESHRGSVTLDAICKQRPTVTSRRIARVCHARPTGGCRNPTRRRLVHGDENPSISGTKREWATSWPAHSRLPR